MHWFKGLILPRCSQPNSCDREQSSADA